MAKLIILLTLLMISTTVTTTTTATSHESSSSCQKEIKKLDLSDCRTWFTQGAQSIWMNTEMIGPEMCCSELSKSRSDCRCEAIRMAMQVAQHQQGQREGMQQMSKMAEMLPNMCMWESPTSCT